MDKIWKKHWPTSVDEPSIRFPDEPLPALLSRQAERVPDRPALIFYGREVTFRELDAAVSRFAGWLRRRGIEAGDRVAVSLENSPQFAIAYYGSAPEQSSCVSIRCTRRSSCSTNSKTPAPAPW
jgi:long-chain acyl-CoA synthetase